VPIEPCTLKAMRAGFIHVRVHPGTARQIERNCLVKKTDITTDNQTKIPADLPQPLWSFCHFLLLVLGSGPETALLGLSDSVRGPQLSPPNGQAAKITLHAKSKPGVILGIIYRGLAILCNRACSGSHQAYEHLLMAAQLALVLLQRASAATPGLATEYRSRLAVWPGWVLSRDPGAAADWRMLAERGFDPVPGVDSAVARKCQDPATLLVFALLSYLSLVRTALRNRVAAGHFAQWRDLPELSPDTVDAWWQLGKQCLLDSFPKLHDLLLASMPLDRRKAMSHHHAYPSKSLEFLERRFRYCALELYPKAAAAPAAPTTSTGEVASE
jgi:hypothetical protein